MWVENSQQIPPSYTNKNSTPTGRHCITTSLPFCLFPSRPVVGSFLNLFNSYNIMTLIWQLTLFTVLARVSQRVATHALIAAPLLQAGGTILAGVGVAGGVTAREHPMRRCPYVTQQVHHFVIHCQTADAAHQALQPFLLQLLCQ